MQTDIFERGRVALSVLNNPDFKSLSKFVENDVFERWVKTNVTDTQTREALHSVINGLHTLIKKAEKYVSDAEFEENKQNSPPEE